MNKYLGGFSNHGNHFLNKRLPLNLYLKSKIFWSIDRKNKIKMSILAILTKNVVVSDV